MEPTLTFHFPAARFLLSDASSSEAKAVMPDAVAADVQLQDRLITSASGKWTINSQSCTNSLKCPAHHFLTRLLTHLARMKDELLPVKIFSAMASQLFHGIPLAFKETIRVKLRAQVLNS